MDTGPRPIRPRPSPRLRRRNRSLGGVMKRLLGLAVAVIALVSAPAAVAGTGLTPAGWRLTPAGAEATVLIGPGLAGPWGAAISPDGRSVLVTSSGTEARFETVERFQLDDLTRTGVISYDGGLGESVFYGIVYSPDGRRAWASGGGQNVLHAYDVTPAGLTETGRIPVANFPSGIAYGHTPLGGRLYVANNLGGDPFTVGAYEDPPGHTVTVVDPAAGTVTKTIDLGEPQDPYGVVFSRDGRKAYVTNWTGRSVAVIDTARQAKTAEIVLSPSTAPLQADHPSGIAANPVTDEIYTANANSDTVSVIDTRTDRLVATIPVGLLPDGPKGSMPEGLDVSPNGETLYVALSGENAVAVVDLAKRRVDGFVPTAWYPSDVKATPDGKNIVVVNTNGSGAGPNRCGGTLNPLPPGSCTGDQYVGSMIRGSVERIPVPSRAQLEHWSKQVRENNRATADVRRHKAPEWLKEIDHVIYVIKENRTYDQVYGDLAQGNGDPAIALFKDDSAPNHRELARRFTLLDNN